MRLTTVLLVFLVPFADAQTARKPRAKAPAKPAVVKTAPPATAWPIASLNVRGNRNYRTEDILSVAALRIGQTAGAIEFDAARERLIATGLFDSVGYNFSPSADGKHYAAVFEVAEIGQIFPWRIEAVDVDQAQVRAALRERQPLLADKMPATQPVIERMARAIEDHLKAQGKAVALIGRLSPESSNELTIVFRPSELPAVAEVKFEGNKAISTATLQQAIASTAIGSLYTDSRFQQILENAIRPVYENEGYIRVAFPKVEAAPVKDVKGLAVTVHVVEGPAYKLKDVRVEGTLSKNKELLKTGAFQMDETVNFRAVQEGIERMLRSLRRDGYIDAKASSERKVNDAAKNLDLEVRLDPGPLYNMGKLTLEGLDIQTEPHIRKLWAMKAGGPFNVEYPDYFLHRLREDQVFDNLGKTTSSTAIDRGKQIVDVTLTFRGEPKSTQKDKDRAIRPGPPVP